MELLKIIQNKKLDDYRNSYNNLGVNQYLFEVPSEAEKAKDGYDELLMENVKCVPQGFTKWDKVIEISPNLDVDKPRIIDCSTIFGCF